MKNPKKRRINDESVSFFAVTPKESSLFQMGGFCKLRRLFPYTQGRKETAKEGGQ
jgi:hypothetical protein